MFGQGVNNQLPLIPGQFYRGDDRDDGSRWPHDLLEGADQTPENVGFDLVLLLVVHLVPIVLVVIHVLSLIHRYFHVEQTTRDCACWLTEPLVVLFGLDYQRTVQEKLRGVRIPVLDYLALGLSTGVVVRRSQGCSDGLGELLKVVILHVGMGLKKREIIKSAQIFLLTQYHIHTIYTNLNYLFF